MAGNGRPTRICSAVAEGELYWQLFAVTHTVAVLRQVKEALLQAEQQAIAPLEAASMTDVPGADKQPLVQVKDLWA